MQNIFREKKGHRQENIEVQECKRVGRCIKKSKEKGSRNKKAVLNTLTVKSSTKKREQHNKYR